MIKKKNTSPIPGLLKGNPLSLDVSLSPALLSAPPGREAVNTTTAVREWGERKPFLPPHAPLVSTRPIFTQHQPWSDSN